jgi:hypothetical protein
VFRAPAGQRAADTPGYREFVSSRAQLLNQSPELRNC